MSNIIGYRTLTIHSSKKLPLLEQSINKYLKDGWTLHGNTLHTLSEYENKFSQAIIKYSDSTLPYFHKYAIFTYCGKPIDFEEHVINSVNNAWALYGYTWHTIDSKGLHYYSQAAVKLSYS
jgi:hypothetical protein